MSDNTVESLAQGAGVDVDAAKTALAALDETFNGEVGDIPDGALYRWVDEFFDQAKLRNMARLIGKEWESDIDNAKPADRAWEKGPDAAKIKAQQNLEKQKKDDVLGQLKELLDSEKNQKV